MLVELEVETIVSGDAIAQVRVRFPGFRAHICPRGVVETVLPPAEPIAQLFDEVVKSFVDADDIYRLEVGLRPRETIRVGRDRVAGVDNGLGPRRGMRSEVGEKLLK